MTRRAAGFTLLETLVALAILAIALSAAFRAVAMSTTSADELRLRILADWVAENRLAEHRALRRWPPTAIAEGEAEQAGIRFRWREEIQATPNPYFRRVDIKVFADASDHALSRLSGLVTNPAGAP